MTYDLGDWMSVRTRPPSSPPATQRSSAIAPQSAGAAQRKVALSTPVRRGQLLSVRAPARAPDRAAGTSTRWRPRDRLTCSVGGPHCPSGLDERFRVVLGHFVAATMRKAMSASVIESRKASASTQMLTCWMFVINARIASNEGFRDRVFLLHLNQERHERAATRGRIAMECHDEHGGVKPVLSVQAPAFLNPWVPADGSQRIPARAMRPGTRHVKACRASSGTAPLSGGQPSPAMGAGSLDRADIHGPSLRHSGERALTRAQRDGRWR